MAFNGQDPSSTSTHYNINKKHTSPFAQFDISSTDVLDTIDKMHCPTCNKNVRYFCNKCLHLVNCPEGSVPQLKLPVKIDIIKHEQERDGKSTALHAKILAPEDVEVYGWKTMPEYKDADRLLLLFPSPGAKRLCEIDPTSFDKLVVIDGTWDQANKMSKSESPLFRMKRVTIEPHDTLFWRHQRKADDHLATIEAIYYFLREYHETYLSALPESVVKPSAAAETAEATEASTTLVSVTKELTQIEQMKRDGMSTTKRVVFDASTDEPANASPLAENGINKVVTPHKEYIDPRKLGPYTNQYDDMLWFYKYFYDLIQKTYCERTDGREFTLKHKKGYIRYHNGEENNPPATSTASASFAAAETSDAAAATATEATSPSPPPPSSPPSSSELTLQVSSAVVSMSQSEAENK